MKKILSLILVGILMIPHPIHTMQPAGSTVSAQIADLLYSGLKGATQFIWYITGQTAYVASEVVGKAATDLGVKEAVGAAATSTASFGKTVIVTAAVPTLALYGAYWLVSAKPRQDLKELKHMLEPANPLKLVGEGNLICNWNMKDYPTAMELAAIGHDAQKVTAFLISLADGCINHRFKNVHLDEQGLRGWNLVHRARQTLFNRIQEEKRVLEHVLRTLRGEHTMHDCEQNLKGLLQEEVDGNRQHGIFNTRTERKKYIGSTGLPLKRWLGLEYVLGLYGNSFGFDYADELKKACKKAGTTDGIVLAPSELTPAQYKVVDDHMKDRAQTWNNKLRFIRGHVHFAQAARLYWDTYKKYHRLQVIEAMLNNIEHQLPMQQHPQPWNVHTWNPNLIQYHFPVY